MQAYSCFDQLQPVMKSSAKWTSDDESSEMKWNKMNRIFVRQCQFLNWANWKKKNSSCYIRSLENCWNASQREIVQIDWKTVLNISVLQCLLGKSAISRFRYIADDFLKKLIGFDLLVIVSLEIRSEMKRLMMGTIAKE